MKLKGLQMVRLKYLLIILFIGPFSVSLAGGGITHMYIAKQAINHLPNQQLKTILLNNLDAYLVGAAYPDSGYIAGTHYGEDSHWDTFIYTFADYLKQQYKDPAVSNPKLLAFLFGCATHRVSDEIIHFIFYPIAATQDFKGNGEMAHEYGDAGIDFLLTVDQNQWTNFPTNWWLPIQDLLAVYQKMGKKHTADEIIWGNSVLYTAEWGERLIALPLYPYYQWKMPWTASHYSNWPIGGIEMNIQQVVEYELILWYRLQGKPSAFKTITPQKIDQHTHPSLLRDFAEDVLNTNTVSLQKVSQNDGSVTLQEPVIQETIKFKSILNQLIAKAAT